MVRRVGGGLHSLSCSLYLAPEHHRWTLPEALVGFAAPVAHHPLEDGVFGEHEQNADDDADDEQKVETGVLVEVHRRSLALQLAVGGLIRAPASLEEQVAQVVCEPAVVVVEQLLRQLRLPQSPHLRTSYSVND